MLNRAVIVVLTAALGAATAAQAQTGRDDPITRTEAERLSPAEMAARFLPGEMAPEEAADARLGGYGPLETDLHSATVLRTPGPAPEHAGFCRQTGYFLTFEPADPARGAPGTRGGRDDPYVFDFSRAVTYYAEAPADGDCAATGGWGARDNRYFAIRGDAGAGLAAIAMARAAMARARDGEAETLQIFCDDMVQAPGRSPCADEPGVLADLAGRPVDVARYMGPGAPTLPHRANPCDDWVLAEGCFQITFAPTGEGRGETWRVYAVGSPEARSLRIAAFRYNYD